MIFHLNRQTLETRSFGQAFRDCPALEHTIFLQPKVKVMTSGPMLFDHEDRHIKSQVLSDVALAVAFVEDERSIVGGGVLWREGIFQN